MEAWIGVRMVGLGVDWLLVLRFTKLKTDESDILLWNFAIFVEVKTKEVGGGGSSSSAWNAEGGHDWFSEFATCVDIRWTWCDYLDRIYSTVSQVTCLGPKEVISLVYCALTQGTAGSLRETKGEAKEC